MPRPSPVSDAVRRLVEGGQRHVWSLDELLAGVRPSVDGASFSAVLRAVWALERAGLVERVGMGDGKARYEVRRAHHEHVRCTACGQVAEVPGCVLEEASSAVQASTGYQVRGHQVIFEGLCPLCSGPG